MKNTGSKNLILSPFCRFIPLTNSKGTKIESEYGGVIKIEEIKNVVGSKVSINDALIYISCGFNNIFEIEVMPGDTVSWDEGLIIVSFQPFINSYRL